MTDPFPVLRRGRIRLFDSSLFGLVMPKVTEPLITHPNQLKTPSVILTLEPVAVSLSSVSYVPAK